MHAHTLHSALVSVTHDTQGERQVETGVSGTVGCRILMKVTKGGVSGTGGSAVGGWGGDAQVSRGFCANPTPILK